MIAVPHLQGIYLSPQNALDVSAIETFKRESGMDDYSTECVQLNDPFPIVEVMLLHSMGSGPRPAEEL